MLVSLNSFLAGVESGDQCLLNSDVLSCFSGVILSIRSPGGHSITKHTGGGGAGSKV